jgi:hypothetical protein
MHSDHEVESHFPHAFPDQLADPWQRTAKFFRHVVVIVVFTSVVTVAVTTLLVAVRFSETTSPESGHPWHLGRFTLFVSSVKPTPELMLAAGFGMVIIALFALSFDLIVSLMVLSPRLAALERLRTKAQYSGQFPKVANVIVLIPAHNEEHVLPSSLGSLLSQSR